MDVAGARRTHEAGRWSRSPRAGIRRRRESANCARPVLSRNIRADFYAKLESFSSDRRPHGTEDARGATLGERAYVQLAARSRALSSGDRDPSTRVVQRLVRPALAAAGLGPSHSGVSQRRSPPNVLRMATVCSPQAAARRIRARTRHLASSERFRAELRPCRSSRAPRLPAHEALPERRASSVR